MEGRGLLSKNSWPTNLHLVPSPNPSVRPIRSLLAMAQSGCGGLDGGEGVALQEFMADKLAPRAES